MNKIFVQFVKLRMAIMIAFIVGSPIALAAKPAKKSVKSKPPNRIESKFSYRTNLGYENGFELEVQSNGAWINGRKLSLSEMLLSRSSVKRVLHVSTKKQLNTAKCFAGTYQHVVLKDHKVSKIERGCLNEFRFQSLMKAYQKIDSARTVGRI